jgi:hypothetical protein
LRVRVAGANHEIIGERRLPAHIEGFDVMRLDFVAGAADQFQLMPAGGFELFSSFSDGFSSVNFPIII